MSLFEHEQIRQMKPGEFKVYNYITSHMEEIPKMNIRQLAEATGVSTTTVLRLCEKAGCEGYTELKYRVRQELGRRKKACVYDPVPAMQFIRNSEQDGEFLRNMDRAAGICENAGMIILCGDGGSAMLARYGAYLLNSAGKAYGAYLLNSAGKAAFSAENGSTLSCPDLDRGNVLLVLSASGDDGETVEQINRYKAAGAFVISVTNTGQCPAAQMADISFACYMPEIYGETDHISRISQIPAVYILERLAAAVQGVKTE